MSETERYQSPLGTRYASSGMQALWSSGHRSRLWRRIWLTLAEEQKKLGVDIPDAAISAMKANQSDVDLDKAREFEKRFRHDVMAHVHTFGEAAPEARAFIHLGATSAFVTDNADMLVIRDALAMIVARLRDTIAALSAFARQWGATSTVAYTHFQPAQLTTIGKRATLWIQDLELDARELLRLHRELPCRGCKGTTGTQASYLELFDGDHDKVRQLDQNVARSLGFNRSVSVSGQTYTRKLDSAVLDALAGVAQSLAKYANDMRLLQHEGELLEPFESEQIGSSAMAYKRNPMRTERICALARYAISQRDNTAQTASVQWFERTLDDSANRRLALPESFLAIDAILILAHNVARGIEVREQTVRRNVDRVMPFMATERWLMLAVQAGGDRQELHEVIRKHSMDVYQAMEGGAGNDLVDRLAADPGFGKLDAQSLRSELQPERYTGRSEQQVAEYLDEVVEPLLEELKSFKDAGEASVTV